MTLHVPAGLDRAQPLATLPDVRVVVLLAGSVAGRDQSPSNGRGVLALPLDEQSTVLDEWIGRLEEFALASGSAKLDVRIAVSAAARAPTVRADTGESRLDVSVVQDRVDYRGTAGTLRDLTSDLDPDDVVLVVVASQLPQLPLATALGALEGAREGVCVSAFHRSDVAGLFLLRRERLLSVSELGFFDLKEQLCLDGSEHGALSAARLPDESFVPLRTRTDYLSAVRARTTAYDTPGSDRRDPFAERWMSTFAIVEPGAVVAHDALVQDSVVLEGAVIRPGATIVRSVVCSGAVVEAGRIVVDQIVVAKSDRER